MRGDDKDMEFTGFRKDISKMRRGKILEFINIQEKVFAFTFGDLSSLVCSHLDERNNQGAKKA